MNHPAVAMGGQSLLLDLVEDHFGEAELAQLIGPGPASIDSALWDKALRLPVTDFLGRRGKEFRGNLVRTSYSLAGGQGQCPPLLPVIVEVLHAGSLIIDDIQDQSAQRRGRAALHCDYGLPVALNAGNWMYFWAFALVEKLELEARVQLTLYRTMSRTLLACHHGQALDLTASLSELPQDQVRRVVDTSTRLKTGALMDLAAVLGAVAAGASGVVVSTLSGFGCRLGLSLQMLDDLSGLLSERRAHKGHEDLREGRPTWPWAWLAEQLPEDDYDELRQMAAGVLANDVHPEQVSIELRRRLSGSGRMRIRRSLGEAFSDLRAAFGHSPTLQALQAEIQRLEKSYA